MKTLVAVNWKILTDKGQIQPGEADIFEFPSKAKAQDFIRYCRKNGFETASAVKKKEKSK